jgi:long-chain acyl-CoA synthetase
LVYPEGERTSDGKMLPFNPGIGLMAVQLRVPVVPIHLEGMFHVYSIHHSWPDTGAVRMRIGAPFRFGEGRDYEEAVSRVEEAIIDLSAR